MPIDFSQMVTAEQKRAQAVQDAFDQKMAQINAERQAQLQAGMPYEFPDGSQDIIQTREQDQINLIVIRDNAKDALVEGVTEPVLEFRAQSDTSYWLTPEQALAMTEAVRAHGYQIYRDSWDRKEALEQIDLTATDAIQQIAAI